VVTVTETFVPDEETFGVAENQIRVDENDQLIVLREVGNGFREVRRVRDGVVGTVPSGCFD
jgi:hypothetical protein